MLLSQVKNGKCLFELFLCYFLKILFLIDTIQSLNFHFFLQTLVDIS